MKKLEAKFYHLRDLYPERFDVIPGFTREPDSHDFQFQTGNREGTTVDFIDGKYQLLFTERGKTEKRCESEDSDVILFHLVNQMVSFLADQYTRKNQIESEDLRRQSMALHIKLLRRANNDWAERELKRYHYLLKLEPFRDDKTSKEIAEDNYNLNPAPNQSH